MDNDNKSQKQVDKLEKLVTMLLKRVAALEAENKRLNSKVIRQGMDIGQVKQIITTKRQ